MGITLCELHGMSSECEVVQKLEARVKQLEAIQSLNDNVGDAHTKAARKTISDLSDEIIGLRVSLSEMTNRMKEKEKESVEISAQRDRYQTALQEIADRCPKRSCARCESKESVCAERDAKEALR